MLYYICYFIIRLLLNAAAGNSAARRNSVPPRVTFTKEEIISAAYDLVRRDGIEKCTARNIAQELDCSTQPIYREFANISELEEEVIERAKAKAMDVMLGYEAKEGNFLSIGMGYLDFARKEPHLFNLIFMSGRTSFPIEGEGNVFIPLQNKMKKDPFLSELDEKTLEIILRDMFIYTHGLATLGALNKGSGDRREKGARTAGSTETDKNRLLDMGGRLITVAVMKKRGLLQIEKILGGEVHEHHHS
jgi:AcrR family transcriptional regulator